MTIACFLGSNGLLGSALSRVLNRAEINLFKSLERFGWDNETKLTVQLESAVKAFVTLAGTENSWQTYWSTGIGSMSSPKAELVIKTRVLSILLNLFESEPGLIAGQGCPAFASSAGAIYPGGTYDIITENTHIAPTTAYGYEKLKQENLICAFAITHCKVTV